GALGDEEDCQRGRDQARLQGDRRDGRRRLAASAPSILRGAAARRALDSRRRYDDQAALRPSGRGGPGLQSQEAGASEPLLSHLFDGLDASCSRCRRLSRRRTYLQARRAEPVGAARSAAARPLANLVAWRLRFRQRGDHARGRGARTCLPVQRLTANVKRMIEKLACASEWVCAGQGFEAKESEVRLTGWSRQRRVIVLRRRLKGALGLSPSDDGGAPQLAFIEIGEAAEVYEYSVLVTSLDEETEAFGQLYRDRGDGENIFDEMKNQWGWGGFTTHD